ncbi:MAG TPA: PaaI family thioesterase [Acidimicrobiales bacterium]|nr:PaaI family thioesterase [Acidimicrobiales bacterium]
MTGARPGLQVPPNCDLTLGLVCLDKSEPGRSTWQAVADERFTNPAGILQGGFLAAIADSAMGAAAVTYAAQEPGRKVSSANVELKASFLRPARVGTILTCRACVISGGDRVVFCEAEISDEEDRLVAKASSTYVITPRI